MCSTCIFLCVKGETLRASGNDAENWTDFVNVNVALMKRVCQLNIEQLGSVALYYITQYIYVWYHAPHTCAGKVTGKATGNVTARTAERVVQLQLPR